VDNLAIGEARYLNALIVFNKELIYGYRCVADPSPSTTPHRSVRVVTHLGRRGRTDG
jgi:hypothetical protein